MIGERIKQLRDGEPQGKFAARFGISRSTVLRYENGERLPDSAFISAVCKAYNVDANWLLTGEGPKNNSTEELAYPETKLTLGEHVDILAKVHNSCNTALIKSIDSNLHAFSEAVDNKELAQKAIDMMDEMNKRMQAMEDGLTKLKEENKALKRRLEDKDQLQETG